MVLFFAIQPAVVCLFAVIAAWTSTALAAGVVTLKRAPLGVATPATAPSPARTADGACICTDGADTSLAKMPSAPSAAQCCVRSHSWWHRVMSTSGGVGVGGDIEAATELWPHKSRRQVLEAATKGSLQSSACYSVGAHYVVADATRRSGVCADAAVDVAADEAARIIDECCDDTHLLFGRTNEPLLSPTLCVAARDALLAAGDVLSRYNAGDVTLGPGACENLAVGIAHVGAGGGGVVVVAKSRSVKTAGTVVVARSDGTGAGTGAFDEGFFARNGGGGGDDDIENLNHRVDSLEAAVVVLFVFFIIGAFFWLLWPWCAYGYYSAADVCARRGSKTRPANGGDQQGRHYSVGDWK